MARDETFAGAACYLTVWLFCTIKGNLRWVQKRLGAAPLQALGNNPSHERATPFEDEDDDEYENDLTDP